MTFIAGPFTISYGGASVGQGRDLTLEYFVNKQLITGDSFGTAPQDAVYQGTECFCDFTMLEHDDADAQSAFWPYAGTFGIPGTIGVLDTSVAQILLLAPVAGTTAASQTTPTLTAALAVLAEGFPIRLLYMAALREIPIRLRLYPDSANSNRFFALS